MQTYRLHSYSCTPVKLRNRCHEIYQSSISGSSHQATKLSETIIKPRANGRNIVSQQLPKLLDVTCCVRLHTLLHVVGSCCVLLRVVAQSLKPVKLSSQQLPTFLLFRDRRSVAQQCWTRLHSSSNIVGATHAHYAWITKTCGLYSSHDALQVTNLSGVVASVCRPLPIRTQQLSTLLRPFARSLTVHNMNSKYKRKTRRKRSKKNETDNKCGF